MSNLDRNDSLANQTSFPGKKDIIELTSAYILFDCYRIGHPLLPGHIWCRAGKRIYSHKHFHVSTIVMILCLFPDHNTVNIRFKTSSKPLTGRGYWKYTVSLNDNDLLCHELHYCYELWVSLNLALSPYLIAWMILNTELKDLLLNIVFVLPLRKASSKHPC